MNAAANTKRKKSPTNMELLLAIETWRNEDRAEATRRLNSQDDKILGLASKGDVTAVQQEVSNIASAVFDERGDIKLAEKTDVQPVVDFYKKLVLSAEITQGAGKWTSRLILGLAALLIALGVISGGFKSLVIAVFTWAMPK